MTGWFIGVTALLELLLFSWKQLRFVICCFMEKKKDYIERLSSTYDNGMPFIFFDWRQVFGSPEYLNVAKESGEVVWSRGLLKKGYGLCHGVSGNAYSLMALYTFTKVSLNIFKYVIVCYWFGGLWKLSLQKLIIQFRRLDFIFIHTYFCTMYLPDRMSSG